MITDFIPPAAALLVAVSASFTPPAHACDDALSSSLPPTGLVALAEADPVPGALPSTSAEERTLARDQRREQGRSAARGAPIGEADPLPAHLGSVQPSTGPSRAERRAELARANRAGELGMTGETSH